MNKTRDGAYSRGKDRLSATVAPSKLVRQDALKRGGVNERLALIFQLEGVSDRPGKQDGQ